MFAVDGTTPTLLWLVSSWGLLSSVLSKAPEGHAAAWSAMALLATLELALEEVLLQGLLL